jgi:hypothetical protein
MSPEELRAVHKESPMSHLLRIGHYTINLDNVAYIDDQGATVDVYFVGSDRSMPLSNMAAQELRHWLDANARAARAPAPKLPPLVLYDDEDVAHDDA